MDVNVDVVDDEVSGRPRTAVVRDPSSSTSPPPVKAAKRSSKATTSGQRGSTASASKPKRKTRQVVWTDDEDDDVDPLGLTAMDPDDEEFEPEPSAPKRSGSKSKIPKTSTKPSRTKTKVEEKDIVIRDERKLPPPEPPTPKDKPPAPRIPLKRAPSSDERLEASVEPISTASADVPESTPQKVEEVEPPPKKRKLPTIKKNKPSTGPSTPTPAKIPAAVAPAPESSTPSKDPTGPVGVAARKPAAALGAADFDLRDKSVYDQLFNRVRVLVYGTRIEQLNIRIQSKQTPDSGLNRKQREEERRKQLYKLRDEARAKRMEEAVGDFPRVVTSCADTWYNLEARFRLTSRTRQDSALRGKVASSQLDCTVSQCSGSILERPEAMSLVRLWIRRLHVHYG